jgi:multiple sugar transport system ATP-binding protein
MASVTLAGIRKIYQDGKQARVAVDGLDLAVADGEFVVLVGPSGCGKSTTLRMIAGLESISAGELRIGERVVNEVPAKDRNIAMVFQNYALYPHMTAYENMAFGLKLRGLATQEIDARVREAAAFLAVEPLLHRRPRHLSGGEQQRVALGRALVRKPEVFLFDEPLSNLDAKLRLQMRREIARLHHELRATMLYVTHDQAEAMTLGDRLVVLDRGRVQQIDTPLAMYRLPQNTFVAGFIGSPAMNLLDGTVVGEGGGGLRFEARDATFSVRLPEPWQRSLGARAGTPVILGVRPEDVRPAAAASESGVPMRLDLVEPLGQELLVSARTRGSGRGVDVTARLLPGAPLAPGQEITLEFNPEALLFFDPETHERIRR